jgi:hypothetical protein
MSNVSGDCEVGFGDHGNNQVAMNSSACCSNEFISVLFECVPIPLFFHALQVLSDVEQQTAVAVLNRPKALNALSTRMVEDMYSLYRSWEDDPRVACVLLKVPGPPAASLRLRHECLPEAAISLELSMELREGSNWPGGSARPGES